MYKRVCKITVVFNFQIKKSARISTLEASCLSFTDYIFPPTLTGYHYLDFFFFNYYYF